MSIRIWPWETSDNGCISGTIPDDIMEELKKDEEYIRYEKICEEEGSCLIGGVQYDDMIERAYKKARKGVE